MKPNLAIKIKALITALVITGALALTEPKPAHAYDGRGAAAAVFLVVAAVATYATVVTTICTPIAAFKARDHAAGFSGAFKECWYWYRLSEQPASKEADESQAVVTQQEAENTDLEE